MSKAAAAVTTFTYHADPGHAWLQVTAGNLMRVGLNPTDFSRSSYRKGNLFYLEEDSDAAKFLRAWTEKFGKPATTEVHQDAEHWICRLPPIY